MRRNYFKIVRILIALLFSVSLTGHAQQLPDSGFEDWSGAVFDDKPQNKYWHASNVTQFGFKFNFAHREAGHSGNYCGMVQDQEVGAAGITEVSPGYMSLGTGWAYVPSLTNVGGATAGTYGGISFTYRPDSISVWIKRTGNNVTKENYNIVFYSWTGTAKGTSYKNKDGGCTDPGSPYNTDEESDIRLALNKNECVIATQGNQVAEAWRYEKKEYANWTKITIPIYYLNDDVPEKCNLIFSASNYPNFRANSGLYAGNSLYVDDVELIYSDKIDHIYIGNKEWKAFDPNSSDVQVYSLGTATIIPEVYGRRGVGSLTNNRGASANFVGRRLSSSEMTITRQGVIDGDPMEITVRSEDGQKSRVYKIQFVTKQSNNARLANITVNGQPLADFGQAFNAYISTYNVALPYGTTAAPVVACDKAEDAQQVSITQASSKTGTATITVTAQDGSTNTYTLNFSVAALSDNTLQNILIDGEGVKNFAPTKTTYTVELPLGTTAAPSVSPISAYASGEQTITIVSNTLEGGCQISVSVPGNASTRTYKLTYKITPSSYTKLNSLQISGYDIHFDPEIQAGYLVTLPMGTTELPAITWTAGDKYQTITGDASAMSGTDGVYKVIVTAANGDQLIYKITFSTLKSENALLKAIMLNGTALEAFEASTFTYSVPMAIGETTIPTITWTPGDEYQTITSTVSGMTVRIFVTAGDGKTSEIYTLTFTTTTSDNCSLQKIFVGGVELDNFDANTLNYTYELPIGTTTLPAITYTQGDEYQTVKTVDLTSDCEGQYKLMVTSNSGKSQTYVIEFSVKTSSNTNLSMIYVNGTPIEDFVSTTLSYNVSLPKGTTTATITFDKGDATQEVTLPATININGSNTIIVKALDGSTRRYTLVLDVAKSNINTLSALYVDGTLLADFSSTKTEYTYNLPSGISAPMIVTYNVTDASATASQRTSGMVTTITVTAENGDQQKYTITFVEAEKSDCAVLSDIQVDSESIVGFNPTTLSYTITLPAGTTKVPTITYTKCDANQSVTELPASSLTKTYKLIVAAEDGSATNTYSIKFSVSSESAATLTGIFVGGSAISNFSYTTLEYSIELPNGTTSLPEITCTTSNGSLPQIILGGVNSDTHIILGSMTYTLHFSVAASSNAQLAGIQVSGLAIEDFAAETYTYTYGLPYETTKVPVVTASASEAGQTVNVIQASSVTGIATIYVVSADHKVNKQYTVQFFLEAPGASTVSSLAEIQVGGVAIANFKARITDYNIVLPRGTESLPEITWTLGEAHETVVKTDNGVDGITTLVVTAEDGESTTTYSLHFSIEKSENANLADIKINGESLEGFAPNKYSYNYPLEAGTTEAPAVAYTKGDEYQSVSSTEVSLEDGVQISVLAEDGVTSHVYTIHFTIAQAGVSTLLDIQVNGTSLPDFETSVFNYTYILPVGTTAYPAVTFTPNDEFQEIKTISDTERWTETIIVKAQTGAVSTYTVTMSVEKSDVATLADIQVNGVSLEDFDANTFAYVITLPAGEVTMPVITYTKGDELESVSMQQGGIGDTTFIFVRSQSGTAYNIYKVLVKPTLSIETTLNNILLDSTSIVGFHPSITEYSVVLPYGTTVVPVITYETADVQQTVKLITNGVDKDAFLIVTAGNGDQTIYTIHFSVAAKTPSSNAMLNGIYLDGLLIAGFAADQYDYNITLPSGTTTSPIITVDKSDAQAVVIATPKVPGTATIVVTAEDGIKTATYTIVMKVVVPGKSSNSQLRSISIGGIKLADFVPTKTEYSYNLNMSATSHPEVTFEKDEVSQNVFVTPCQGAGDYYINVEAEDGSNTIYTIHFVAVASSNVSASPSIATITPPEINIEAVNGQTITAVLPLEYGNADITVIAENGDTATYVVPFNSKVLSSNVAIEGIIYGTTLVPDFSKTIKNYNVVLPADAEEWPVVSVITEDATQTITVSQGQTTTIVITAEDGVTSDTYTINFSHAALSSDATLSVIMLGTELLATTDEQTVVLNKDITSCPAIYVIKNHPGAVVKSINIPALPGTATIEVMAEDGVTTKTYLIHLNLTTSSDATLTDLYVNGSLVPAWNPATSTYTVALNSGVEPVVTYLAKAGQSVAQTTTSSHASVLVMAEDGTQKTYEIDFTYLPNHVATLSNIQLFVGSSFVNLPDFDKNDYEYIYNLPLNTKIVPSIYPIAGAQGQTIEVTYGATDTITVIKVTAEDGESKNVYKIAFPVAKHSNALLENVEVPDAIDFTFDKNTFEYAITLPYGITAAPILTWETAEGEGQVVKYTSNPLNGPSILEVIAEDGTIATYTFNFTVAENTADNILQSMIVDGVGSISLGNVSSVDVTLPYGTTALSVVGYVKNFAEQNVIFVNNGVSKPSSLVVSAPNKEDKVYTINPVIDKNPSTLTAILVNGTPIADFAYDKYSYIVNVAEVPTSVEATAYVASSSVDKIVNNYKHVQFEVTDVDMVYTSKYDVYFYYTSDVIPNLGFENFENVSNPNLTSHKGDKPIGWHAPIDAVTTNDAGTYYPENAVAQSTTASQGSKSVNLKTTYLLTSADAMPGVISLSEQSVSVGKWILGIGAVSSSSSIAFGDAITYRNTPDQIKLDVNPQANKRVTGWRFLYKANGGTTGFTYEGSYDTKNVWQTVTNNLNYTDDFVPSVLDIIINSAHTENIADLYVGGTDHIGGKDYTSSLLVDNLQVLFNSSIASISVNGVNMVQSGSTFTATIDAESYGKPDLTIVGQVPDQHRDIVWNDDFTQASIRNYAEDGSYSDYTLVLTRPTSSINALSCVVVDNDTITLSEVMTYERANGKNPDVMVVPSSLHSSVSFANTANQTVIKVTSESGNVHNYTINYITAVDGDAEIEFAADGFIKHNDLQVVVFTKSDVLTTAHVTASNGVATKDYSIASEGGSAEVSSLLSDLMIDGETPASFLKTNLRYEAESSAVSFVLENRFVKVVETFTEDSININLKGSNDEHSYVINLAKNLADDNADLLAINNHGTLLDGFNAAVFEYTITDDSLGIDVIPADNRQIVTLNCYEGRVNADGQPANDITNTVSTLVVKVIAADGITEQNYLIYSDKTRSSNTSLAAITINGEKLATSSPAYTSDHAFTTDQTIYNVTMLSSDPKLVQPIMPIINAITTDIHQSVLVTNNGLGETSSVLVTAEDGETAEYYLKVNAAKATSTALKGIYVNGIFVPESNGTKTEFDVELHTANNIAVSCLTYDNFQMVTPYITNDKAELVVTAENGEEAIYTVNFSVDPAYADASLRDLKVGNVTVSGFSATNYDYSVTLPVGTTVLPIIKAYRNVDGQEVKIITAGLNGNTEVIVTALDSTTSHTYNIQFSVEPSLDNDLALISIDYVPVLNFVPSTHSYSLALDAVPTDVKVTFAHANQMLIGTPVIDTDEQSIMVMYQSNGVTQTPYIIEYTLNSSTFSSDAEIDGIYLNETMLPGFDPATTSYSYELPIGTTVLPEISLDLREGQTVTISSNGVNGTTTITVTAEDGITRKYYTIAFSVAATPLSNNALLSMIYVDGESITDFASEKKAYNITLPTNTTALPMVCWLKGELHQTVLMSDAENVITLQVTAEDGVTTATYTITCTNAKSNNALLKNILVNGMTLSVDGDGYQATDNFDATITYYELDWNMATTATIAQIVPVKNEDKQTIEVTPDNLTINSGKITIKVTAEDGVTSTTYTLRSNLAQSTCDTLKMIYADGMPITSFKAHTYEYQLNLEAGSTFQLIDYLAGDAYQTISETTIPLSEFSQKTTISVMAQTGAEKIYSVTQTIAKFAVDTLAAIYVDPTGNGAQNVLTKNGVGYTADYDFSGTHTIYNITWGNCMAIPADFTKVITFDYDTAVLKQTVTINQPLTSHDGSMILTVTAQNGSSRMYIINCKRSYSSDNTIASVLMNDDEYTTFSPEVLNYNEVLPVGSPEGVFPAIDFTLASECATADSVWTREDYSASCLVTVTAENGQKKTYTFNFTIERSSENLLSSITINGMPIFTNGVGYTSDAAWDANTAEYNILWNVGTTDVPVIGYVQGDPYQTVEMTPNPITSLDSDVVIKVTAGDGVSTMTYTLHNTLAHYSDNTLKMIYYGIPYVEVPDFQPEKTSYSIDLEHGTESFPVVNVAKNSADWQNVTITWDTISNRNAVCHIAVQPEDTTVAPRIYDVNFTILCSTSTDLIDIFVNGKSLAIDGEHYTASAAYSNSVNEYSLTWEVGTTAIPSFMAIEGDDYQTIDIKQPASLNDDALVTVMAEDSTIRVITIHNTLLLSTNNQLSTIELDGREIDGFNPTVYAYTVNILPGVRTYPEVTYEKGDQWQTVSATSLPAFVPGSSVSMSITVMAQDSTTSVYTITFVSMLSEVATLNGIFVNSNLVNNFVKDTFDYAITWPIGSTALPVITYEKGDTLQTVVMTPESLSALDGTISFKVTAEDGIHTNTYTLKSTLLHSYNDSLTNIYYGSAEVPAFHPDTLVYNITLPVGTRTFPTITFDNGDKYQTVVGPTEIARADYAASYEIKVTAEAGNARTYRINYTILKSANADLEMIYVDNKELPSFSESVHEYSYVLPTGTTEMPDITWLNGDEFQKVDTVSGGVNGDFVFTITAEDGSVATYTIHFSVALSTESRLSNIFCNLTGVPSFDEDITEYNIVLPYGSTELPDVTYTKKEEAETVKVNTTEDMVSLVVTAEDGISVTTYILHFSVARSSNAYLLDIALDGTTLENFDMTNFEYDVVLPYGQTQLPAITYTTADDQQIVNVTVNGKVVIITVTSGDGENTNEYIISFTNSLCPINWLNDLAVRGATIDGFHQDTLVYTISYPAGTKTSAFATVDDITFVKADSTETVAIDQQDEATIIITVTAEDGTPRIYVIVQEIRLSDNSLLADIIIDGQSLKNFESLTFDYTYYLYEGVPVPSVDAIPQDTLADVAITVNNVGEVTYIYCTAEDGSESIYTILFAVTDMDVTDEAHCGQTKWVHIPGTNQYKAITIRENVQCALYDASGRLISIQSVTPVDPNKVVTVFDKNGQIEYIFSLDDDANGTIFTIPEMSRTYIYIFYYDNKTRLDYGKFTLIP